MSAPSSTTTPGTNESSDLWILGVALAVVGAGFALWLGTQAAAIVHSHHHVVLDVESTVDALKRLPSVKGDPRLAFEEPVRSQLPGPILFWTCVAMAFAASAMVVALVLRVFQPNRTPLDRRSRLGVATEARLATARDLAALIVPRPMSGGSCSDGSIATCSPPRTRRDAAAVGVDGATSGRWPSSVRVDRARHGAPRTASVTGDSPPSCRRSRPTSWRPRWRSASAWAT
ncbi:MAG: hypothetical protein QOG43_422 [Actinomycetota bacterium]|nr:hypothetical protein [Actinomycetota bacterium]